MEAMAAGRAVVATDTGDIPYLAEDGKSGFESREFDQVMIHYKVACLVRFERDSSAIPIPEMCIANSTVKR